MGNIKSKNKKKDDTTPPGMIRVYINGGNNEKIHCYPHITIGNFVSFIREEMKILSSCNMILIHNNLIIQPQYDQYKSLTYYNIRNNSCLLMCISQPNKQPKLSISTLSKKCKQTQFRNNCCSMTINNGYIETIRDLDILNLNMNPNCLKMKCGHGMPQSTLYHYTSSQLHSGADTIKCPHIGSYNNKKCDQIWYFPAIKNTLLYKNDAKLTPFSLEDVLQLDIMIAENMIKNHCSTAHCRECNTWIYKDKTDVTGDSDNDPRTFCPRCENVFCWQCGIKWKNLNSSICENNCVFNFEAEVTDILLNCASKQIGDVSDVPTVRCCPKCLQLITHSEACKHVKCKTCQCHFCFVCMGINDGEWNCGGSGDVCPVASRKIPTIQS